jgi:hypothetical protein
MIDPTAYLLLLAASGAVLVALGVRPSPQER